MFFEPVYKIKNPDDKLLLVSRSLLPVDKGMCVYEWETAIQFTANR